jgi:hypothetical protein
LARSLNRHEPRRAATSRNEPRRDIEEDGMERETGGGSDYGRDLDRDLGDDSPASIRDAAPDYRSPIDANARVSGHVPPPESAGSVAESPEQDWGHARAILYPVFRPVGTQGLRLDETDPSTLAAAAHSHAQPIIDD